MNQTKRLLVPLSVYDQRAMESLLEKQAAEGWLLTRIGTPFWTFERIAPQPLRFAVVYFSKATEYDPLPTEDQKDKEILCVQSGLASGSPTALYAGVLHRRHRRSAPGNRPGGAGGKSAQSHGPHDHPPPGC